jgi:acyl-CoA synthetase (AMP-forming)/AMP-acid ligase II
MHLVLPHWKQFALFIPVNCITYFRVCPNSGAMGGAARGQGHSSIELENAALSHPDVGEAAVIGVRHPVWSERPLLLVVPRPGAQLVGPEVLAFLAERVAKWWLPDDVVVLDQLPHTATGKLWKEDLRERYREHWMREPHG